MPPAPQQQISQAFHQSRAPVSAYARHRAHAAAQTAIYHNPPPPPSSQQQRTDRDILLAHHRFLPPSDSTTADTIATTTTTITTADTTTTTDPPATPTNGSSSTAYEQALARSYDRKLFKEYVLVELSQHRVGRVAMRWRTAAEVRSGKGETVCAALGCAAEGQLVQREVLFSYVETSGDAGEALVKVRLCPRCAHRLAKARGEKKEGKRAASRRGEERGRGGGERRRGKREEDEGEEEAEQRYRRRDEDEERRTRRRGRRRSHSRSRSRSRSRSLHRRRARSSGKG